MLKRNSPMTLSISNEAPSKAPYYHAILYPTPGQQREYGKTITFFEKKNGSSIEAITIPGPHCLG